MSRTTGPQNPEPEERRDAFRIDDVAVLTVRPVSESRHAELLARFEQRRGLVGWVNDVIQDRENDRPLFKQIETGNPSVARYLSRMESRIDQVARQVTRIQKGAVDSPTAPMNVNISTNGLRVEGSEYIEPHTAVEIDLELQPTRIPIYALGRVVWCGKLDGSPSAAYQIGIEFETLDAQDRELLAKHIMSKQFRRR